MSSDQHSSCSGGRPTSPLLCSAPPARLCPRLQDLEIQHGPQLRSSAVEELCQAGGLAALRTLTLTFTATSAKALVKFYSRHYAVTTVQTVPRTLMSRHLPPSPDNCPQLSSLILHFSLETFLPTLSGPDSLSQYKKILTNLQVQGRLEEPG